MTGRRRPSLVVETRSQWRPRIRMAGQLVKDTAPVVRVDVYGANPLVEELRAADRAQYSRSLSEFGLPPTLFNTGDWPLYLASGVEVTLLEQLPWIARPTAARADGPTFASILDRFGAATEDTWEAAQLEFGLDPAVERYRAKVLDWGITDPNDRIRAHLPAGARAEFPTNNDGTSW